MRPVAWPKKRLFESPPSTNRVFAGPRWPANAKSPPRVGSLTTPGVSVVKSMKLRPLTGRSATARSLTVVLVVERVDSIIGASEVTETVSDAAPTSSRASMVATAPTSRVMFFLICVLKPWNSNVKS